MKKSLLVAFALACAVAGNAQSVSKGAMVHRSDLPDMPRQKMVMANGPRRAKKSVDNGLYYTIPGALYGGWTVDGMGYAYSMAMVPPFVDVTFANQATDKFACSWFINGNDITEYAEENGDYVGNYSPDGWYYTPALQHRKIEGGYQYNEDNYWAKTGQYDVNDISVSCTYSPELMMTPVDNHGHRTSNGNVYRNSLAGYGFLSTSYLFGTGQVDLEDDGVWDYTAYGFEQTYNPLLAPMYVDEIHINAVTMNNYGPIPAGKSVKAYIIALDEEGAASELLATFEATASDTLDFQDKDDDWQGQTAYFGSIVYRNTETFTDIFGNQTSLPAAIPAGVPFRIQFEGMDEEGVSIGAYALWKSEVEDTYIDNGYLLMKEGRAFTFQSPLAASIDILGQYEVIDVQTKDFLSAESQDDFPAADFQGWNVLRVSADGQSVSTAGLVGNENYDMGCAFVGTSVPWFDEEGLPNYDVDEELLPEWVEGLQVDTTYYNSDVLSGYNLVIPVCKPLPEGVTGRSCTLDIFGNAGIAGNNQIIILQGDANLDGIVEVKADKKVIHKRGLYNLNGQSISTPVDGQLYIRDGKKYLNRKK
ncbi:MAG: hypothetical protein J5548_13505 [Prevotella sp.]|nr:hypothetical protein [Prevotella sp.]